MQASYIYDPYGRYLTGTGTLLTANAMRFSSKTWVAFSSSSATSGLYYYGYRFYDPYLQRWMNRDPIAENGGVNLYCFVGSNPAGLYDRDGRGYSPWPGHPPISFDSEEHIDSFKECWTECMNALVPFPLKICTAFSGFGALAAKVAAASSLASLFSILPTWAMGSGVGCAIGCGLLL